MDEEGIHLTVQCSVGPCPGQASTFTFQAKSELLLAIGRIVYTSGARFAANMEVGIENNE